MCDRAATLGDLGGERLAGARQPRRRRARDPQADRREQGGGSSPEGELRASADQDLNGREPEGGAEHSGDQTDDHAFHAGDREQIARAGAAGSKQRQVAPVALTRAQRRQVGDAQSDQRARHGQQQEQGLGVERIARRGVERVGEVVDELDLSREGTLQRG